MPCGRQRDVLLLARGVGRRSLRSVVVAAALCASLAQAAAGQPAVPLLGGRVVDEGDLLSPATEETLEAMLSALEAESGAQVAVLTVPSLEGQPIESYALRVAETWELGSLSRDDGVLLLVAVGDRRVRIEVGYGLEETLPDIVAGRIIRDTIAPGFRQGDYDGGVLGAVLQIAERISPSGAWASYGAGPGETAVGASAAAAATRPHEPNWEHFWAWIVFLLLMPLVGAIYGLVAKGAEARGIIFGALLLPILLGGSLAADEVFDLPADSGLFMLGGAAAVLLFSGVFWWLHFRLKRAPDTRSRWQERLDRLADGRLVFSALDRAGLRPFAGSETARRWLRRATMAAFYLGIGGCIAWLWSVGYAIFYFHNLVWLFVIFRAALHPDPTSGRGRSSSWRSARSRSVHRRSSRPGRSAASGSRAFRGGGGSFGGGGASGSW